MIVILSEAKDPPATPVSHDGVIDAGHGGASHRFA